MQHTALNIVKKLKNAGHEAYWVGGCVRDVLLHKEPKDYDIATSATPDQIESIFEKTFPVGRHFGVILTKENEHIFEIATFRSDGGYSDGRRPDAVYFSTPEEDAKRRDFTINGIFFDPTENKYHDFVDGMSDLKRGILRFIGDPNKRIQEDHLRIIRAVRFRNRFQLEYDTKTKKALKEHAALIIHVSPERLRDELTKILADPYSSRAFKDLDDLGIGEKILPAVWECKKTPQPKDHHTEGSVFDHLMEVLDVLPPGLSIEANWAALLHDIGKADTIEYDGKKMKYPDHHAVGAQKAHDICKQLMFSRKSRKAIEWIIHHHHIFDTWEQMRRSRQLFYYDHPHFEDLIHMHKADILGSIPNTYKYRPMLKEQAENIHKDYYDVKAKKQLPSQIPSFLTGDDIIQITGIKAGKEIGKIKQELLEKVLEGEITKTSEAQQWVKQFKK